MKRRDFKPPKPGYVQIFRMAIRHWKTGRLIRRADGRPFVFWVPADRV